MSGRFHLTVSAGGRAGVEGWWSSEAVARGKFGRWVGRWGGPGTRITLVDEETGTVLTEWPEEP